MISDEAVEVLAAVIAKEDLERAEADGYALDIDTFLPAARRAAKRYLEAAAPYMLAAVADEREGDLFRFTLAQREWLRTNPYRSQA